MSRIADTECVGFRSLRRKTFFLRVVGLKSWVNRWVFSTNHKDIGSLYLILGGWGGVVGMRFSLYIRLELMYPSGFFGDPMVFKAVITAHGLIMIFFFVMPVLIGGFGNWLVPVFLGSADMAFPRMKNLRFWLLPPRLLLLLGSFFSKKE